MLCENQLIKTRPISPKAFVINSFLTMTDEFHHIRIGDNYSTILIDFC